MKILCHNCEAQTPLNFLQRRARCPKCEHDLWVPMEEVAQAHDVEPIWFVMRRGSQTIGPLSRIELGRLARAGHLTPKTFVLREGQSQWCRADEEPTVCDLVGGMGPTSPDRPRRNNHRPHAVPNSLLPSDHLPRAPAKTTLVVNSTTPPRSPVSGRTPAPRKQRSNAGLIAVAVIMAFVLPMVAAIWWQMNRNIERTATEMRESGLQERIDRTIDDTLDHIIDSVAQEATERAGEHFPPGQNDPWDESSSSGMAMTETEAPKDSLTDEINAIQELTDPFQAPPGSDRGSMASDNENPFESSIATVPSTQSPSAKPPAPKPPAPKPAANPPQAKPPQAKPPQAKPPQAKPPQAIARPDPKRRRRSYVRKYDVSIPVPEGIEKLAVTHRPIPGYVGLICYHGRWRMARVEEAYDDGAFLGKWIGSPGFSEEFFNVDFYLTTSDKERMEQGLPRQERVKAALKMESPRGRSPRASLSSREPFPGRRRQFAGERIVQKRDVTGVNFRGADFRISELTQCTFLNCNFTGAKFIGAKISQCTFKNCVFDSAMMDQVTVSQTDFEQCRMTKTSFVDATFSQGDITGGSAVGAVSDGAELSTRIDGLDARDASMIETELDSRLKFSDLTGASF